jgi:hypothetical protein
MLVVGELQPLIEDSPSQYENLDTATFSGLFCTTKPTKSGFGMVAIMKFASIAMSIKFPYAIVSQH